MHSQTNFDRAYAAWEASWINGSDTDSLETETETEHIRGVLADETEEDPLGWNFKKYMDEGLISNILFDISENEEAAKELLSMLFNKKSQAPKAYKLAMAEVSRYAEEGESYE